jgi:C_GCAxxG_C_C family probable redox protein
MTDTKNRIVKEAYNLGFKYEKEYLGCAQCVFAALQDSLGLRNRDSDLVFKAATALAGGVGSETDGHCGAYSGGVMMFGHLLGRERDNFKDPEGIRLKTAQLAQQLHKNFIDEYGTVICRGIHTSIMGRPFYLRDPDERRKFDEAGGHLDKCTSVVGNAAAWSAGILLDAGLVKPE